MAQGQLIDAASYTIQTSAGITGGTVTFQNVCADNVARPLAFPPPIALASSQVYTGSIPGQYVGLQLLVSGLSGGTITFAEIKNTFRKAG